MIATFSDGNNIYSVDFMFAYINIYKRLIAISDKLKKIF